MLWLGPVLILSDRRAAIARLMCALPVNNKRPTSSIRRPITSPAQGMISPKKLPPEAMISPAAPNSKINPAVIARETNIPLDRRPTMPSSLRHSLVSPR